LLLKHTYGLSDEGVCRARCAAATAPPRCG
jgi:hypothetical protein